MEENLHKCKVPASLEACSYINELYTATDDHHITVHIAARFLG